MIPRLLRTGWSFFVYFCLATFIAQVILLAYFGANWQLDRSKLIQALAVLQGVDLVAMTQAQIDRDEASPEQISYEQILEARAAKFHNLQLREQALNKGLELLASEQRKLTEEKTRYEQLRQSFDKELLAMQEAATAQGREDVLRKMTTIKPKQAKELLVEMLNNDEMDEVVALLSAMADTKAAKIITEFKLPEEIKQMYEILRRIGKGFPEAKLAADTREQLRQPNPTGP